MPDYIYLLENRLSADQRNALRLVSEAARDAGMTVFLVGGAVRDLISGSSVRDLDVAVQGNALKLKKSLLKSGAKLWGEQEASRTLFLRFPVAVSIEVSSARREEYPKLGKPVYHWASILEDLRRRDFTANAMALSLNEHSYGLLMDPLNGVADIEARQLRLVSNYGFLEEPARLLRAARLATRLGWEMEERTKARYDKAKEENAIEFLTGYQRGYELEEIGHEEDGLRVLKAMENEGWMRHLDPHWTSSKADTAGLEEMHKLLTQLQIQGINPDTSSTSMELLTAKLSSKERANLKHSFVRPGFVEEWDALEGAAKSFAKQLTGKEGSTPSATWKLFTSANPQAVLWLGLTSKAASVQEKYKNFFTVWPEARQKVPYALMSELRITPELPGYDELLWKLFFAMIDGKLETEEQMRAFLEPFSPPAPPPPVTVRRSRGSRKSVEPKVTNADLEEEAEIKLDQETEEGEEPEAEAKPAPEKQVSGAKKSAAAEGKAKVQPLSKTKTAEKPAPAPARKGQTAREPQPKTSRKTNPVRPVAKAAKKVNGSGKPKPAQTSQSGKKPLKKGAASSKSAGHSSSGNGSRSSGKQAHSAKSSPKTGAAKNAHRGRTDKPVKKRHK